VLQNCSVVQPNFNLIFGSLGYGLKYRSWQTSLIGMHASFLAWSQWDCCKVTSERVGIGIQVSSETNL